MPVIVPNFPNISSATCQITTQDLSNDELGEYINFLNIDYSKWFNNNLYDSVLASIEDSAERFGADLCKKIAKLKPAKREKLGIY